MVSGSVEEEILAEAWHAIATFGIGNDKHDKQAPDSQNSAWTEAYRIELLLLLVEPPARLIPELEYRLSQAEVLGLGNDGKVTVLRNSYKQLMTRTEVQKAILTAPKATRTTAKQPASAATMPKATGTKVQKAILTDHNSECELRSILIEIVKRIQWLQTKKYLSRALVKKATFHIVVAALSALILFLLPYIVMFVECYFNVFDYEVPKWIGFPLYSCLTAGLFGSYFSRLIRMQQCAKTTRSYDELVNTPEIVTAIVRGSVGVCGAALLYFVLHARIIEDKFIPDFTKFAVQLTSATSEQYPRLLIINSQLALLIVWSFFAGFSERLVPSVLATTEGKLGNGARPTPPLGSPSGGQ